MQLNIISLGFRKSSFKGMLLVFEILVEAEVIYILYCHRYALLLHKNYKNL